jgi:hypothetical protein
MQAQRAEPERRQEESAATGMPQESARKAADLPLTPELERALAIEPEPAAVPSEQQARHRVAAGQARSTPEPADSPQQPPGFAVGRWRVSRCSSFFLSKKRQI